MKMELIKSHRTLLFLAAFVGLGAYVGAFMLIFDPSGTMWGMDPMLPYMQCLPLAHVLFVDFLFSGVMLVVVNGLFNTIAFVGLYRYRRYGVVCSSVAAVLLLCWLSVQWVIFVFNPLTTIYTVMGIVQLCYSVRALRLLNHR